MLGNCRTAAGEPQPDVRAWRALRATATATERGGASNHVRGLEISIGLKAAFLTFPRLQPPTLTVFC
jgi:hypothetical protein